MEEREELMVSSLGGNPSLRNAHFLKPTITSNIRSVSPLSKTTICDFRKNRLNVSFRGRVGPLKRWKTWVEHLLPKYHQIWKRAGIYEAILTSTFKILGQNDLIISLAERWCLETNTFMFPWAEATFTLEDMIVLGGYSVLGDSVSTPLRSNELMKIEENLMKRLTDIRLRTCKCHHFPSHAAWMNDFMDSGDEVEHEAFLALWLSRHVLSTGFGQITRSVLSVAIHLSRGTPLALAPAVLAVIYRNLSLLKKAIISSSKVGASSESEGDDRVNIFIWAPLQFVQIWAWERFPTLRPTPNMIEVGEPRSARWHKLKELRVENVGRLMDSAGESFQWRPYCTVVNNWSFNKFYREKEEWVMVASGLDEELESFAQCLRPSELVGLGCIEQYLPHRVAMQFGLDQDVPASVPRFNSCPEVAWSNYKRPIGDAKLYIPPRLFESDVTVRYFAWWIQAMLAEEDKIKGIVRKPRSKTSKGLCRSSWRFKEVNKVFVPFKDDSLTIKELLISQKKTKVVEDGMEGESMPMYISSPEAEIVGRANTSSLSINNIEDEVTINGVPDTPCWDLDARISRLERQVYALKAERFGLKF